MRLRLGWVHYQHLMRVSLGAAPGEAIAIWAGRPSGDVTEILDLPNLAPPGRFMADPRAQFLAEKRILAMDWTVLALWHSHPDGGSVLSPADLLHASAWGCAHAVMGFDVRAPHRFRLAAYAIRDNCLVPLEVKIDPCPKDAVDIAEWGC
jgi:proteasome lid subunit RPN8/RPN11